MTDTMCKFTSMDAANLVELVDKTVIISTKQKHISKGVVHTIDPVTKSLVLVIDERCEIFSGVNIKSIHIEDINDDSCILKTFT